MRLIGRLIAVDHNVQNTYLVIPALRLLSAQLRQASGWGKEARPLLLYPKVTWNGSKLCSHQPV